MALLRATKCTKETCCRWLMDMVHSVALERPVYLLSQLPRPIVPGGQGTSLQVFYPPGGHSK
jgi:hypothetical protein